MSIENNKCRIERMNTWISHAEPISGEESAHIRFLFFWIAYEAAYQTHPVGNSKLLGMLTSCSERAVQAMGRLDERFE